MFTKKTLLFFLPLLCFAAVVLLIPSFAKADVNTGLVGYWNMDSADVDWTKKTILDRSGNGDWGNLVGMTSQSSVAGKYNQALQFDGSTSYIQVSNPQVPQTVLNFSQLNAFTLSVWVNFSGLPVIPTGYGNYSANIISARNRINGARSAGMHLSIYPGGGTLLLYSCGATKSGAQFSFKPVLGQWYHFVYTVNGATETFYINGAQASSAQKTGACGDNNNYFAIGSDSSYPAYFFNGLIDETRVYNQALSAQDVSQLYQTASFDTTPLSAPATPQSFTSPSQSVSNGVASINLSWSANTESSLSGYRLYVNNVFSTLIDKSQTVYQVNNLSAGTAYTFQLSALNTQYLESPLTTPLIVTANTGGANVVCSTGDFTLAVNVQPSIGGSINPSGVSCHSPGAVVSLTASPASGFSFNSWSGDLSGANSATAITMDSNKTVNAIFQAPDDVYLRSLSQPVFKTGHTLPALSRWGGGIDLMTEAKEFANWDYAIQLPGIWESSRDVLEQALNNPKSSTAKGVALVNSDPSKYKLAVYLQRVKYPIPTPDDSWLGWTHDANGNLINGHFLSPLAPDSYFQSIGDYQAGWLQVLQSKMNAPIAVVINGGEEGLQNISWGTSYWKQDPLIVSAVTATGGTDDAHWQAFVSSNKARQATLQYYEAVKSEVPGRDVYIYYYAGGSPHRNASGMDSWNWDYKYTKTVADAPSTQFYYKQDNGGFNGASSKYDMLVQLLNAKADDIANGTPLGYGFLCGGYENTGWADIDLYQGFLKMYYASGMIGGVAGYFSYENQEVNNVNGPYIPGYRYHRLDQMVRLGYVHAEFSWLENFLRNGTLLPGPNAHILSTDRPAYEFPTNYAASRVLVRKLNGYKDWLITAWAQDGVTRAVNVTIPVLGTVSVTATPAASIYDARIVGGVMSLTEIDNGSQNPTPLSLPSSTPDSDGSAYVPPTPVSIPGSCGSTANSCASGAFSDVTDSSTNYLWNCQGVSGGSTAACSIVKASSDTTKPTITLTSPLNGANHSGTITITASAADAVISGQIGSGLAGVQFRLDGVNLGSEDTISPYSINWDTSGSSNGSHSLDAIARDGAGNTQVSQTVTITISNINAPANISCTSFTYSSYGACEPSKTQSRYILSRSPLNCSGGVAEALIRNCSYTAPAASEKTPSASLGTDATAVIVGFCGFTPDSCPSGVFAKIDNTKTSYRWKCAGANGGNAAFCSLPLSSAAVSAKLAADKKAGTNRATSTASQVNPPNPLFPPEADRPWAEKGAIMYFPITNTSLYNKLKGKIILRVESKGEAYYISPKEKIAYYLGRPADAFQVMRYQGLGITNIDLAKIQIADSQKINASQTLANRQKGMILLQVESKGEAWYVNPNNGQRHFLSRPADAFNVMRKLGLGINEKDYGKMGGK